MAEQAVINGDDIEYRGIVIARISSDAPPTFRSDFEDGLTFRDYDEGYDRGYAEGMTQGDNLFEQTEQDLIDIKDAAKHLGKLVRKGKTRGFLRKDILEALDELMELARTRVTRSLTPGECRQFLHLDECP